MAILTGNWPDQLRPGVHEIFGLSYKDYEPEFSRILDVRVPDELAYEEDNYGSGFGFAQQMEENSAIPYDSATQEYVSQLRHVPYGLGFVISEIMMEDGTLLRNAEKFTRNLKQSMLKTREQIAANVYNNAFSLALSSTGQNAGGDTVAMCVNNHPSKSGNQSNVPSTIAELSEATLEQAVIDIAAFKNSRNLLIQAKPTCLVVHPTNQFQAERILKTPLRSGSTDNDINAMLNMSSIPDVVVSHYLTSNQPYFIRTDVEGALVLLNRKDITLRDDNEFDTSSAKFKGQMRLSVGWLDWRGVYGVNAT